MLTSIELVLPGSRERAYIAFPMEHQSTVDERMPLRVYGYTFGAWTDHVRRQRAQKLALFPLPAVLCIVVHHSETGWTAARSLHELFDPRVVAIPELARHLPNFELIVDDLSGLTAEDIIGRARAPEEHTMVLVLLGLRFGRSIGEFFRELLRHSDFIESLVATPAGRDAIRLLMEYVEGGKDAAETAKELLQIIEQSSASRAAKEAVMSIAEQLKSLGMRDGIEKGIERTLRRQLTLKFGELPDDVVTRLGTATEPELELWTDRVLTAQSLDEVFA